MSDSTLRRPKHREIYDYLHAAIAAEQYATGQRLPTDGQLMRQFATSRPTVARAMHDLEQAGLVERRPGSGTYVRRPGRVAHQLLGLLIPGLGETEIFEPICGEIARACQKHQFGLLWGDTSSSAENQELQAEELCRRYIEQRVAGVFFAPVELTPGMDQVNREIAHALDRAGIAVVLLDRDVEAFPRRSGFDLVGIDNFRAGYLQAEHLLGLGCRRLHYVARPLSAPTVDARIAGYRQALADRGILPEGARVHRGDPADVEFVRSLLADPPEAFLCANDITAANLMRNLIQLGFGVPGQVRVMGLDDVKYARLLSVPLSTLRQPCRELGAAAVAAMVDRLQNRKLPARSILLDTQLVTRESCGAGRTKDA
jgi:GntR family transcriptional regulator of arabinose operon